MVLGWLVCGPSAGCVVTDKIEFDAEQNVPPMIVDTPSEETPIGHILWVNKATSSMVTLSVKVRDPNVTQALKAHWRLVSKDAPTPPFDFKDVAVTGDLVRDLTFELQTSPLGDGQCARLELVVSGSFKTETGPQNFDQTRTEGDIDSAEWLIWEGEGPNKTSAAEQARLLSSCPTNESLLEPSVPEPIEETL
jgi:hypothetical protein